MQKLTYVILLFSFSLQGQIKFDTLQWKGVLDKAKTSNKLIFLDAYAVWCEPCEEMEEYVFTDLEVGNFYNKNFINFRMDMEEYPGVDLAEKYTVGVYPNFLFINGYGELVHRGCGAMDANEFLLLAETALDNEANLMSYEKKYRKGERSTDFLMNYLALLEEVCLDAERFAGNYLASLKLEELKEEPGWAVFASYNWDIYSREFQYLLKNKNAFAQAIDLEAVEAKIYDAYLAQYQEVYEAEELHGFGMRALMHSINQTNFTGADTLKSMMSLHYAEFTEDWESYAESAIDYVGMMGIDDPEELGELAWKFYLFVDDRNQLEIAASWAKAAVDELPEPSIIDTYASLQYKLGNKKKAIDLGTKALELAREFYEDTEHFEYQLKRFRGE